MSIIMQTSCIDLQASPVCEIELTFLDFNLRDQDTIILRGSNHDVNVTSNIVTLSTEQLTTNRLYQVTIEARNIAGLTSVVHMISESKYHLVQ